MLHYNGFDNGRHLIPLVFGGLAQASGEVRDRNGGAVQVSFQRGATFAALPSGHEKARPPVKEASRTVAAADLRRLG